MSGVVRRAAVLMFMVVSVSAATASQAQAACGGLLRPKCPPPPACSNWTDDDRDGVRDLDDPGCTSRSDGYEGDDAAPDVNGVQAPGPDVDPRTTPVLFGFNSHLSGFQASGVSAAQEAALVTGAGGEAQRLPIEWYRVQPSRYEWDEGALAAADALYERYTANGGTLVLTLGSAPVWASDYASCGILDFACRREAAVAEQGRPPREIQAFARFARRIAERYPLAVIETWNEPNITFGWNAARFPDPWRMAAMQCAAYDAVKALPGGRTVLSPGMAIVNATTIPQQAPILEYMRDLHDAMNRVCWDGLSVHAYPSSQVGGDDGSLAVLFRLVRNVRRPYGDRTPIWVTETGASTSGGEGLDHSHTERTPAEQSRIIRETVNELLTTPDVRAVLLHTLRDRPDSNYGSNPADVQYGFGMLRDGSGPHPPPKPAYCHLASVAGNTYPGC